MGSPVNTWRSQNGGFRWSHSRPLHPPLRPLHPSSPPLPFSTTSSPPSLNLLPFYNFLGGGFNDRFSSCCNCLFPPFFPFFSSFSIVTVVVLFLSLLLLELLFLFLFLLYFTTSLFSDGNGIKGLKEGRSVHLPIILLCRASSSSFLFLSLSCLPSFTLTLLTLFINLYMFPSFLIVFLSFVLSNSTNFSLSIFFFSSMSIFFSSLYTFFKSA